MTDFRGNVIRAHLLSKFFSPPFFEMRSVREAKVGRCLGTGAYGTVHELAEITTLCLKSGLHMAPMGVSSLMEIVLLNRNGYTGERHLVPLRALLQSSDTDRPGVFVVIPKYDTSLKGLPSSLWIPHAEVVGLHVARAIQSFHDFDIVHCDVKNDNVMVDLASESFVLGDYGVSHYVGTTEGDVRLPSYFANQNQPCAPELCVGKDKPVFCHRATDVWQLGFLLAGPYFPDFAPGAKMSGAQFHRNIVGAPCDDVSPIIDEARYDECLRALLPTSSRPEFWDLVASMLRLYPQKRPVIHEVVSRLEVIVTYRPGAEGECFRDIREYLESRTDSSSSSDSSGALNVHHWCYHIPEVIVPLVIGDARCPAMDEALDWCREQSWWYSEFDAIRRTAEPLARWAVEHEEMFQPASASQICTHCICIHLLMNRCISVPFTGIDMDLFWKIVALRKGNIALTVPSQ